MTAWAAEIWESALGLLGVLSGWKISVMFAPAVMRAFRKNKTLRYGVPMLVSGVRRIFRKG